jgi:hypothetical protein
LLAGVAADLATAGKGTAAARITAAATMPPPRIVAEGSLNDPDVVDFIGEIPF